MQLVYITLNVMQLVYTTLNWISHVVRSVQLLNVNVNKLPRIEFVVLNCNIILLCMHAFVKTLVLPWANMADWYYANHMGQNWPITILIVGQNWNNTGSFQVVWGCYRINNGSVRANVLGLKSTDVQTILKPYGPITGPVVKKSTVLAQYRQTILVQFGKHYRASIGPVTKCLLGSSSVVLFGVNKWRYRPSNIHS